MELLYRDSGSLKCMRDGLLGAYVDGFAQQMLEQGYARASVRYALQLVADFGRWLSRCRIRVPQVNAERLACYQRYRSRSGHFRTGDASILRRLLTLLNEQGVAAMDPAVEPTSAERLEGEFRRYLEQERRLAPSTVFIYLEFARRFLTENCRVSPEARRQGLLFAMSEAALSQSRGAGVFATSHVDNVAMHRSLEKLGFQRAGDPYPSGRAKRLLQVFVRPAAQPGSQQDAAR